MRPRIETETTFLADCEESRYDRLFDVNVKSIFLCLKYQIRAMLAGPEGGAIVNIASTNSFRPRPKQSIYTATKHAVVGMTKTAAIEYAGAGIRINAIAPGAIDTPMLRDATAARGSKEKDVVAALSLVGRLGRRTRSPRPPCGCAPPQRPTQWVTYSRSTGVIYRADIVARIVEPVSSK